jgi:hypothetical protein
MIQTGSRFNVAYLTDYIRKPRQVFSTAEDQVLARVVEQLGDADWSAVARQMPGRSARQCRDRWKGYLSPDLSSAGWTPEEDDFLMEQWALLGTRWSLIAAKMQGRSEVSVRNRVQLLERRKVRESTAPPAAPAYRKEEEHHHPPIELSTCPQIPMPANLCTSTTTQRELAAFFKSLQPHPSLKP